MRKLKEIMMIFLLFLSIIQSVSAISDVQHSLDGDKVTLTYQGTPPFWINIRGDTNIGQGGGYIWTKTYSNSFSYNVSFAINPSGTFYYGVKDNSWSMTNKFMTGQIADENIKDLSKFSSKNAFLTSDEDWRNVLTMVPLTVWTNSDNTITKYPLLIYHKESNNFDIDSIYYFFEQYHPDKITYFENIPSGLDSLLSTSFNTEQKQNIFEYWSEYKDVVYVENNYELALLASTYASLINAPLIIKSYNDDIDISKKNVICIGSPTSNCHQKYNLTQLQEKYRDSTNTDKIILTNINLNIIKLESKNTNYGGEINQLFGKTSLASPYLASSKKELIIPISSTNFEIVDDNMEESINNLNFNPMYLTILASPLEIQNTIIFKRDYGFEVTWSIDNTKYGNLDDDLYGFAELKTGRIYGFSMSDVSSYLARVLFYDNLEKRDEYLFIGQGVGASDKNAKMLSDVFNNAGYNSYYKTYSYPALPKDWANKIMINNDAHGSPYYSTITTEQIPQLNNTVIFTASCLTCAFDKLSTNNYGKLFCLELLRKGSLGVVASVDNAGFNWDSTRLNNILSEDIGTTFKKMQNLDHARNKWYIEDLSKTNNYSDLQADIQLLLGDPTLKIPFNKVILPDIQNSIVYTSNDILLKVIVPSMNVEDNGEIYTFIEGTDSFVQAKYAKFFLKIGPINLFENYKVESEDVTPISFGGIKAVAIQEEDNGKYIYFLIEKDLSSNSLNAVINNIINIKITKQ